VVAMAACTVVAAACSNEQVVTSTEMNYSAATCIVYIRYLTRYKAYRITLAIVIVSTAMIGYSTRIIVIV
jgi:hypothetical protein